MSSYSTWSTLLHSRIYGQSWCESREDKWHDQSSEFWHLSSHENKHTYNFTNNKWLLTMLNNVSFLFSDKQLAIRLMTLYSCVRWNDHIIQPFAVCYLSMDYTENEEHFKWRLLIVLWLEEIHHAWAVLVSWELHSAHLPQLLLVKHTQITCPSIS